MRRALITALRRVIGEDREEPARVQRRNATDPDAQASATIFLVLRRMRAPLIILIAILAVSVVGLSLIPGVNADGQPERLSIFDAFYFMSYTATTIGFGEIPYAFNDAQRLWVILAIYLTVVGWAYAIGSLLTLLQDRAFRQALALQRFQRKVQRLSEPFLLLVGYGQTGERVARAFDGLGRRLVVLDNAEERIDALGLASHHADMPGLVGDARHPDHLDIAGLQHPRCEGVLALSADDEVNLAVTMSAALLRPELPVVSRTISKQIAHRMQAFGTPIVVNPFDRYGDLLRLALRAPASYQLLTWLEDGPGADLPERADPPRTGRWVVCGYGRFGRELCADLRAEGLEVTVIEPDRDTHVEVEVVRGDGSEPDVLALADLEHAVGFVAGTDNDTTNLSVIAAARRINPKLFVTARQNRAANTRLFQAMDIDSLLVPSEVVAHEAYAQLSTPLLWRFLQDMPAKGNDWAATLITRLTEDSGDGVQALWKVRLNDAEAPALGAWLDTGRARLGDLLRDPEDRDEPLPALVLLLLRGEQSVLAPGADLLLAPGDELLLAGEAVAQRALKTTMVVDATSEYVVSGVRLPSSWIWRKLAGAPSPRPRAVGGS